FDASINKIDNEKKYSLIGNSLKICTEDEASVYSIDGRIIYRGTKYGATIDLPNNQILIIHVSGICQKIVIGNLP
ncbi:MAG: hypothetical protein K2J74_01845, partial [Muribaculaceae bacterium]|nr:hypothetical protein [Muribaculaceae bacterium]